jgi:hypothetical protein
MKASVKKVSVEEVEGVEMGSIDATELLGVFRGVGRALESGENSYYIN